MIKNLKSKPHRSAKSATLYKLRVECAIFYVAVVVIIKHIMAWCFTAPLRVYDGC